MQFDVLTLFPEMYEPLKQSILGKAQENGKIERWWKTIEHSATSPLVEPYLSYIINEYNTKWEHCSLKERYYSSFWDFLIDQFNYLNLFSNISECIQTFV